MGFAKAACITVSVIAVIGVAIVGILAFAPGAAISGSLRDARSATPTGGDAEARRLVIRALEGTDYEDAIQNQQVWGSAIQDFGGIDFHNTIACLLGQAAINEFINEDWYAVSFDIGACPDNQQSGDPEDANEVMTGWVRVSQPNLFAAVAGLKIEMIIFDEESGSQIYLEIRLRGDSTDEAPFGDYHLTMIQDVPEGVDTGFGGMQMTLYTADVGGKSTLYSTMTIMDLDIGLGDPIDLSMNTIFQYDPETGEGLFIDDGFTMSYLFSGEEQPEGCRVYNYVAYSPEYIYYSNPIATDECAVDDAEGSAWYGEIESCFDVADYTEHCWEIVLFNADGSEIEGRSQIWGGFENEDLPVDDWSRWGFIGCEVADNGNDTCCHIEGWNVTSDGPLVFEAWESTGVVEYTATAAAGSACTGGWWNWYDTQVVITDKDNNEITFTPPIPVEYNHTVSDDRNGVAGSYDGTFEYRPGGYNSVWYLGWSNYIKDGTIMGDADQYIAMCPYIFQEFETTALSNCEGLPEVTDDIFEIEVPEAGVIPDDAPEDRPVTPDVVGGEVV